MGAAFYSQGHECHILRSFLWFIIFCFTLGADDLLGLGIYTHVLCFSIFCSPPRDMFGGQRAQRMLCDSKSIYLTNTRHLIKAGFV